MSAVPAAKRHALVCGASAGIGRAVAIALAEGGHAIHLLARSREALDETASMCVEAGAASVAVLTVDMDETERLRATVRDHVLAHGPMHIVIHNTGGPPGGPLRDATEEDLLVAFRRHVLSAQALLQETLPGMEAAGWGRIVNITSMGAKEPIPGLGVSNVIRHGMGAWMKTLAKELPPGITANAVLPGFTDTDRLSSLAQAKADAGESGGDPEGVRRAWVAGIPERRLAAPKETGAAVAWLCSEAASYVRGVSLPVDGGLLQSI